MVQTSKASILEFTRENDGELLSDNYVMGKTQYVRLRCKNNHTWEMNLDRWRSRRWCSNCRKEERRAARLEKIKQIAISKGGLCLSEKFLGDSVKLEFQCGQGHKWGATVSNITRYWCKKCRDDRQRMSHDELCQVAIKRRGKLLSPKSEGSKKAHLWECEFGHRWLARPNQIIHGESWCPTCNSQRLSIEDMKKLAEERNGKVISTKYTNSQTKLLWECEFLHRFKAIPNSVQQGHWCPICAKTKPLTIGDMRRLAKAHGGECISPCYSGANVKLKWRCKDGHQFKSTPGQVNQGHWCKFCYWGRGRQKQKAA